MAITTSIRVEAIGLTLAIAVAGTYTLASQVLEVEAPPAIVTASRSCVTANGAQRPSTSSLESRVPVAAWILGSREGALAGWTTQVIQGEAMRMEPRMERWIATSRWQTSAAAASAERMAAELKVARPPAFTPPRGDAALDALHNFVEADTQTTARALALAHAPWVCELYKLGAYWGYSIPHRARVRYMPNVFAPEIRYYAARLELPEDLTNRMTRGVPGDLGDEQVLGEGEDITRTVAEYWAKR